MKIDKKRYYQESFVADTYDKKRVGSLSGKWTQEKELGAIKGHLKQQDKVLELACGTGRLLKSLRAGQWNVQGLDQSETMLKAGGLLGQPFISVGDVLSPPYPDQSFDGAYCFRFTNHCHDLASFLTETRRVLKEKGLFVFDILHWSPLLWESSSLGGKNYIFSRKAVREKLAQAGFEVLETKPLFSLNPYILGYLPYSVLKLVIGLSKLMPHSFFAVSVWVARKK